MRRGALCFAAIACACVCCLCGCGGSNDSICTLLSVRMRGNGDGTLTAVAQNEFTFGRTVLPVTLALYTSDVYTLSVDDMLLINKIDCDDLNIFQTMKIEENIKGDAYFCACVYYTAGGEKRKIQSDTIFYDSSGNRK